jgi:hypothetical protein
MAFIKLASSNPMEQNETGIKIIQVSETAFSAQPGCEWAKFESDRRGWLYAHGYRWCNADGDWIGDGHIPAEIEIVPVYDTPTRMHVRIPWKGDIAQIKGKPVENEPSYDHKFPILLARYFMRKCR